MRIEVEKITIGHCTRQLKQFGGHEHTHGIGGNSRSKIKTWMKRNRFKHIGWGSTPRMDPFRNSWQCRDSGVIFRIRNNHTIGTNHVNFGIVVDVGDRDFDRWANSTQCTIPFQVFVQNHKQFREIIWSIEHGPEINYMYGVDLVEELTNELMKEICGE